MKRLIYALGAAILLLAVTGGTALGAATGARPAADDLDRLVSSGPIAPGAGFAGRSGSARVRSVQRRLAGLGLHPGPVDGLYGPRTEQAVRRLQAARGVTVDGIVGRETLAALRPAGDAPAGHTRPAARRRPAGARAVEPRAGERSRPVLMRSVPAPAAEAEPTAARSAFPTTGPLFFAGVVLLALFALALLISVAEAATGTAVHRRMYRHVNRLAVGRVTRRATHGRASVALSHADGGRRRQQSWALASRDRESHSAVAAAGARVGAEARHAARGVRAQSSISRRQTGSYRAGTLDPARGSAAGVAWPTGAGRLPGQAPSAGRSTERSSRWREPAGTAARRLRARMRSILPLADVLVTAAVALALLEPLAGVVLCVVASPVMGLAGAYGGSALGVRSIVLQVVRLGGSALACAWLSALAAGTEDGDVTSMTLVAALLLGGWLTLRLLAHALTGRVPERVAVLGSGAVARELTNIAARQSSPRFEVVGCLDDDPRQTTPEDPPVLGGLDDILEVLERERVDRILVAFSATPDSRTLATLRRCANTSVRIDVVPRLFDLLGAHPRGSTLGALPMLAIEDLGTRRLQRAAKRAFDLAASATALVCLLPLMLLVAVAVRLDSPGPVLFRQTRVGYRGRRFEVLKFRTMRSKAEHPFTSDPEVAKLPIHELVGILKPVADDRVTRLGRLLRQSSVDELPQLINVLRGEMSLVGPRPLRPFEVEALDWWQHDRHLVRPGMTGLWQVMGRSGVSWNERMQMDYRYVRNWSLLEDVEILLRTLPSVLSRDGAR